MFNKLKFNIEYSNKFWAKKVLFPFSLYTEKIHYFYFLTFLKKEKELKNKKLLDIGIGDGKFCIFLSKKFNLETIGVDISEKVVKLYNLKAKKLNLKSKAFLIQPDTKKFNFKKNYFDYVLCSHILEHLPDDKIIIKEIYRILKKDGKVYFNIPINEKIDVPTHLRKYKIKDFINILMENKFEIICSIESDYFSNLIKYLGIKNGIFYNILKKFLILNLTIVPIKFLENFGKILKLKTSQFVAICKKKER